MGGVVTVSIDGLSDATQYYFRGYLRDEDYISYSDVIPFYIPAIPVVQTGGAKDITPYTAELYGEVLDECGSPVSECGFVWNEGTSAPALDSDKIVVDGAIGMMTATAEGLLPNKTYTFCAYAVNGSGVAYGAPVTFTTLVALPDLSAADVTAVTSNSATFGGTVTNDGGEAASEVGFYYSTDSAVDPEKSEKVSQEYAEYQRTAAEYAANTLYSAMSAAPESEPSSDPAISKTSGVETKAASDGYKFTIDVYGLALKTRYYVKAYAVNSAGVAYGKVTAFETVGEIPTVKTTGTAELTTTSVVLSGEVVSENGEKVIERGFVWMEGTGTPTTDSNKVKVDGTTGAFTYTLGDLQPNKKYSFSSYAINAEGTAYGEVKTFTTQVALPTVSPTVVSSVTSTSATFTSSVKDHGGEIVYEIGFYYSTDSAVDPSASQKKSLPYSSDSFSLNVTGLADNTKYYVKSYAVNSAGPSYGTVTDFTTSASYPLVKTLECLDVTSTSVVLSGEVVNDNGSEIIERGFVWLQGDGIPSVDSYKIVVDGTVGPYTSTLTSLTPNQKYAFRAFATNAIGTSYGNVLSFTAGVALPSLAATSVTNTTSNSATFTSTVISHGGETVSEVGFYYSTDSAVDPSASQKKSLPYSSDSFSLNVTGLADNTKYYVKSYAVNSAGPSYGTVAEFTTESSLPSVSTIGATDVTESSALISGEVVSDNGAAITERGFVWVKGTDIPTISSNRVKVEGTIGDYTVALSGLYPNQSYSYRAYARNSKGVAYGETLIFKTLVALPELELVLLSDITSSSAVVSAKVTAHGGETVSEVGFLYGTTSSLDTSTSSRVTSSYNTDSFLFALDNLSRATEYYIRPYATNSAGTAYGETAQFVTLPDLPSVTTSEVTDITETSAVCGGVITDDGGGEIIAKGVVWSRYENPTVDQITKTDDGGGETLLFTSYMSGMFSGTTYYVRAYVTNEAGTSYGEQKEFATYGAYIEYFDSANSFIVSEAGTYMFGAVKGNSMQSVGSVASVEVLWESFGTDEVPEVGSLISSVSYNNGTITFSTPNTYRKGNAVIAAKDASGITLWSWHIWLTDQPQEHVYNNYAGTMMDRNLGATSATPGDVGALGLLYQWGRKDPFLGTSSISSRTIAKSTISWPSPVSSDSSKGTIHYAISNPTTFIGSDENDEIDWYYTGSSSTDNTRWQSEKTIYDPCPSGWRVPDGGDYGVWEAAGFSNTTFDSTNRGFSFSISNPSATWYPAAGYRYSSGGHCGAGYSGNYWSVTPIYELAFELSFSGAGYVYTSSIVAPRAEGLSVRCFKEDIDCGSNNDNDFSTSDAKSLSDSGTANSYIVSKSGVYSIPAVKGNSSESVGSVASAEVLWESFGTDVQPSKGDLVETVIYQNGKVYFKTPTAYREGNAVIAAKDASGKILWSWHIWLTDQPQEQEYYNNAGIMMDRNLGATSATPGDVGALGLLYQWGRKDPFLGSSSISSSTLAKSTITWPSNVSSNISNGTIEYATANPTTFITYNSSNIDWYYTGSDSTDNTRWQSDKTIYDPCPAGWRVPDGSGSGVWSKALGSSSSYTGTYDSTNKGMNFSGKFGEASTIWYPDSGYRYYDDGALYKVGYYGYFWSVTPYSGGNAYRLYFDYDGYVDPSSSSNRAYGFGVRCVQE